MTRKKEVVQMRRQKKRKMVERRRGGGCESGACAQSPWVAHSGVALPLLCSCTPQFLSPLSPFAHYLPTLPVFSLSLCFCATNWSSREFFNSSLQKRFGTFFHFILESWNQMLAQMHLIHDNFPPPLPTLSFSLSLYICDWRWSCCNNNHHHHHHHHPNYHKPNQKELQFVAVELLN